MNFLVLFLSLLCGILVYNVLKSKVLTDLLVCSERLAFSSYVQLCRDCYL